MTSERPSMLDLKKQHYGDSIEDNGSVEGHHGKDESPKVTKLKLMEVRMTASLDRVKAFKNAIHKSAWYYTLINRMISENIHEAPLAKFMAGKLPRVLFDSELLD